MPTLISSPPSRLRRLVTAVATVAIALSALTACAPAAAPAARTVTLQTLNASGVTGTVTFAALGDKTSVEITVDPGANPDMPAHIHPGTCANLTPQPKFPLENVLNGSSKTDVPAPIDELFAGGLAVNIHRSNDDLKTYTACVDLR
jgi:ABC-type transport system substrate-binding protein